MNPTCDGIIIILYKSIKKRDLRTRHKTIKVLKPLNHRWSWWVSCSTNVSQICIEQSFPCILSTLDIVAIILLDFYIINKKKLIKYHH